MVVDKQFLKEGKRHDDSFRITKQLAEALTSYIQSLPFKFKQDDPLFFSDRSKGKETDKPELKRLVAGAICNLFRKYFRAAGFADAAQPRVLGMHSFRKTSARRIWDITHDKNAVSKFRRHHSIEATDRYMPRMAQEVKDDLAQKAEDSWAEKKAQKPGGEAPKGQKRKAEPEQEEGRKRQRSSRAPSRCPRRHRNRAPSEPSRPLIE